tara:strand:- start:207 stop:590 length:384 start_codon:yes stop_codon:yes gene_type:complete
MNNGKRIKDWKPIFVENSKVPVILSYISPIDIWAISLVFFVFCRGELSEQTRVHETIHFQQWLELLVIGFGVLYPSFWIWNLLKGMSPSDAYKKIPFEMEAYGNQSVDNYLQNRRRYSWARVSREEV